MADGADQKFWFNGQPLGGLSGADASGQQFWSDGQPASLLAPAGGSSGNATVIGQTIVVTTSLIAGTGSVIAGGVVLVVAATILPYTVGFVRPWVPTDLGAKLRAWFDPNDATTITSSIDGSSKVRVSQIRDKSGNGRHYNQASSTLQPERRASYGIAGSTGFGSRYTLASYGAYYMTRTETILPVEIYALVDNRNGAAHRTLIGARNTTLSEQRLYFKMRDPSNNTSFSITNPANGATTAASNDTGEFRLYEGLVDATAKTVTMNRLSGTLTSVTSSARAVAIPTDCDQQSLFCALNNTAIADICDTELSELVECSAALTATERDQLRGYMAWNSGWQSLLPTGHAYKNFAPTVSYDIVTPPSALNTTVPISTVDGAASGGATATGGTLPTTISTIDGTATGGAAGAGGTLPVTISAIAGAATGVSNATASGGTLPVTISAIAGAASGTSNGAASGATLPVTISAVAGAASAGASPNARAWSHPDEQLTYNGVPVVCNGVPVMVPSPIVVGASVIAGTAAGASGGNANASGGTLPITTSVIAGTASAGSTGSASGATLPVTISAIAGTASSASGGSASGATLPVTFSVLAGAASGISGATANGAILQFNTSLLVGSVGNTGTANGDTIAAAISLLPGAAGVGFTANGATVSTAVSLLPGAADATSPANAAGVVITVSTSLLAGLVTGIVNVAGATLESDVSLLPGTVGVNSTVGATILPFPVSVVRGDVVVDTGAPGDVIFVNFGLPDNTLGHASAGANTPAGVASFAMQVVTEGVANGEASTPAGVAAFSAQIVDGLPRAEANLIGAAFNVTVTFDSGTAFYFIGAPGDDLLVPKESRGAKLLAEQRGFVVTVEAKRIVVPREERAIQLQPRFKKVS